MPAGKLRGEVKSTVRAAYGDSAVSSDFRSKVVHPRNPKLVRGDVEDDKQTPSAYMAEMQLTTGERLKLTYEMRVPQIIELLDMSEQTLQKFTTMEIERPIFQPFPSDIVFQNFEPFETYEVPLQLRNNDKIARLVKVTQTDSPYFKIISPLDMGHKVAPGMDTVFIVQFTPDEKKDYTHELICITEREKFLVPVRAVGARAILDFPDEINFGTCAVKHTTTKTLLVRNIGNRESKFKLSVEEPFSVTPDSGKLAVGESMQIHVDFRASQTRDFSSQMILHYDTGEDIFIALYGASIDYNVRLDKNTLKMENTFISSASQRIVTVSNRSDVMVHFKWTKFATLREQEQERSRFRLDLNRQEHLEKDTFLEECIADPTMRDQISILHRKYENEIKVLMDDKMLFADDIIQMDPLEGDIWPNSQAEIAVIFKPQEAQSYARTVFCDVTGRESRLPLRIRGEGIGPRVLFSFDSLDIGNIFVNSRHSYEVVLSNKGDIDAAFSLLSPSSTFGPYFNFVPSQGIVVPGSHQAVQVHFCSPLLGSFNELFQFAIDGSPEKLKLNVRGNVIGPTFHFKSPKLKFGTVSYGFVHTRHCTLVNTSLIPMTFNLRVPADGGLRDEMSHHSYGDSLVDSNISDPGSTLMTSPREFDIVPATQTVAPQSQIEIKVDFVPMTVKKYDISLVVDVDGVGDEILSLPIIARCVVPNITLGTPLLNYGRCFLHHAYELPVQLMNDSELPANYELLAQVVEDVTPILYSSPEPKGVIQPHSVREVPLQITAESLDEISVTAFFMIFGSSDPPLSVQVLSNGEGPVVHVMPTQIDYGHIPVLTEIHRMVRLSNESLIPARFSCSMVRPNSSYSVEPTQGVIPPEEVLQLKVTANVDDSVRFQDKLSININDSQIQTVSLAAYGTGTTIVSEPPLAPAVRLGPQFSCQPCSRWFCLTNKGRRPQQIYWTTEGFQSYKARRKPDYNPEDMKYRGQPPPAEPSRPMFTLNPDRLVLHPGQSQEVKLEGFCDRPQKVKERMICHAIIGSSTGKEKIMKVDISAEFISPLLEFCQREVNFCVMKYPESSLELETKQVMMRNVSLLPLAVMLDVDYPFQLLVEDPRWAPLTVGNSRMELTLAKAESVPVLIQFDPSYKEDSVTRTAESFLEVSFGDHPQKDYVKLKGDVFFPNLTFEMEEVDFGCILNDTEVTRCVVVTNHSPMDVKYQWAFVDSDIRFDTNKEEDEGIGCEIDEEGEQEAQDEAQVQDPSPSSLPLENLARPVTAPAPSQPSRPSSGLPSRPSTAREGGRASRRMQPSVPLPWMQEYPPFSIGIEEVFDILPLYSTLHPRESQKIQFNFYGHANINASAVARCTVYGGPEYDIKLSGQASLVQYFFDRNAVDYGKQPYDQVATAEIVLHNTGKVNLDFVVLNTDCGNKPMAGAPNVTPAQGHIKALSHQTLLVRYLPGVPEKFEKMFQVRVAHFEPDKVTICGEGVFPRLMFDLPLNTEDTRHAELVREAKQNLEKEKEKLSAEDTAFRDIVDTRSNSDLQMEIERLVVKQHALGIQEVARTVSHVHTSGAKALQKKHRNKAQMLSYLLDFGYVVYGTVRSHVVRVTNNGVLPVSFAPDKSHLSGTGFVVDLDRVRGLPGDPEHESFDFMVTFDPRAANAPLGPLMAHVPIHVLGGPTFGLQMRANVAMPGMAVSTESLDFGTVECGQCKVMTIQLHNQQQVRCDWTSEPPEEKKKKTNKMIPLHLRKKIRAEKPKPLHFEVMPPIGSLSPGQRVNVQIKFMPTEEITYSQKVVLRIAQSANRHPISVTGRGSEPKIEFDKTLIEFGPVLPHSSGDEKEVVIKNPLPFPVEIYSLEFDKEYLEEEKILRTMKGYDEYNTILLPPRQPGTKLPQEIMDAYNEQQKKKEEQEKAQEEAKAKLAAERADEEGEEGGIPQMTMVPPSAPSADESPSNEDKLQKDLETSSLGVGELEITPVSAAIARYLGIDLTAEGKAARNRRGISIVVHGAPLSGKTATAVALAKKYDAALLTVDGVITEAVSSGSSSAAVRARELCSAAAKAAKEAEAAALPVAESGTSGLSVEAVTAHTAQTLTPAGANAGGSVIGAPSLLAKEGRKTSTIGGTRGHGTQAAKNLPAVQQSPPATPPPAVPAGRKLSVSASVGGEYGLYSCVLPEDLLVELLAERLQLSDCQRGIVFDGLETLFSPNMGATSTAILRAFNNRKYIFFVTLSLDQIRLKAVNEKRKEEEAKLEKKREEEEKRRLEEMSEDEYDALTEEEKAAVDRKHLEQKKERLKRENEKQERERREREMQALLEEKRLEEEKNQKGKRRGQSSQQGGAGAKKGHDGKGDKKGERSSDKLTPGRATGAPQAQQVDVRVAAPSVISERSDSSELPDDKKRHSVAKVSKHPRQSSAAIQPPQIEEPKPQTEEDDKEKELNKRFILYEASSRDIANVLDNWDRTTGTIHRAETPKSESQEQELPPQASSNKRFREKKEKERDKDKEKDKIKVAESPMSGVSGQHEEDEEGGKKPDGFGVPQLVLETIDPTASQISSVEATGLLPSPEEVLDGLGLGPQGPPIPPPATFAVVPYPVRRRPPLGSEPPHHYIFVASSPDDPNVAQEDKAKEAELEPEKTPEKPQEKEHGGRKGGLRASRDKDERESGAKSRRERQSSARRVRRGSIGASSPPPSVTPGTGDDETSEGLTLANPSLSTHRWVIPANDSVTLRIRFRSEDLGQFDQTLNFELMGTRRRYQLFCRGVCAFPAISREPRVVFPHRKKFRKSEEIVHKKYILSSETFEFGPLLCGKTRDRFKEGKFPENLEKLTVCNTSPLEAEVSFCFQHDGNAATFLLDPPNMTLKPGESQELTVWSYPKTPGFFEDAVVCCVRENPEPVIFKVSCHGIRPELELDRKQLQFDRVLLHRKDTKTIFLRNSTLLPVAWKVNGMDNLGDDFSLTTEHGIIDAKSEFALQMHFRAVRPTNVKKIVRLEVSDVEQIIGLVQAENIQVHAEAYDVALDMSFPKGADGGLDFGVLRVLDETKQTCSLKNKGKFEINFNFAFEATQGSPANVAELFTILPSHGSLLPTDRPTQVQVIFRSKSEITVKEQPVLKCQIVEPHLGDTGEVIASIPVKISVRSVYSRYNISPVSDINFSAMLVNTKRTRVFAIENKGEFDFRYSVLKMISTVSQGRQKLGPPNKRTKSRDGSSSGRSQQDKPPKPKRAESVRGADMVTGAPNIRLQLGMFTLYPAVGTVPAGGSVQITVDMIAENPGFSEENIAIDISDRPPGDHPQGIPYKLIGEACIPGISTIVPVHIGSIFEEHLIAKQLNLFQYLTHDLASGAGVYGEDENKFIFYNTVVGRKAKARFKISNPNKVPCDLVLSVKPISNKPSAKWHDVYEVEPQRACIPSHSHMYATVTFIPPSMQSYSAIFEAAVDGMPSVVSKYRNLSFEIQGEGNLPRITVQRPTARNKKGSPVMLFRRLLLGRTQVLPLVLKNEGTLVARVNIDLKGPEGVYDIKCGGGTRAFLPLNPDEEESKSRPHTLTVVVPTGKSAEFSVEFTPSVASRLAGELKISVVDNPYEENAVQLIGEGYEDEVTIDNIRSYTTKELSEVIEIREAAQDELIAASKENHVHFGDCAVGVSKQLSFTLTNHSPSDPIRFHWTPPPEITFSPCIGHLQPGCAKDVTVNFISAQPKTLASVNIPCKIVKIKLGETQEKACSFNPQAFDWDDRLRTVRWIEGAPDQQGAGSKPEDEPPASAHRVGRRPAKRKVIETEPEPPFTAIEESSKELPLLISAVCDFAKFKCKTDVIHFKDTLMFQARLFSFSVSNKGDVQLDYQWTFETLGGDKAAASLADESRGIGSAPGRALTSAGRATSQQTGRPSTTATGSAAESSRPKAAHPLPARPPSSCGGRPASALALAYDAASIASEEGADLFPFSIEPERGSIAAGKKATFTVRFSPLDVADHETFLRCSVNNAQPDRPVVGLRVHGRSVLPYCHFELEESSYISGGMRNPELKGPGGAPPGSTLDPNTKVLEFKSCGVKVKNIRRFFVVNPTSTTYNFAWTNEDLPDGSQPDDSPFRCLVPHGTINSGKKHEMVFEYVSDSLELAESFWRFFIPEHNISVPFVLVGQTFEPALSFDRSHINFREMLLGHPAKQTIHLINEENQPFGFAFKEASCHTDGYASSLIVEPMSGSVQPKSRLPVEITFTATAQKEVNFNLMCFVKRKTSPLTLNVKAEGYAMNAQLICEDSQGNKVELTSRGTNRINLGQVEINEKASRQLFIVNSGKFNFDFAWELHNRTKVKGIRNTEDNKMVSITPESGTVPSNTRKRCQMAFCPPARLSLQNCDLFLKITNGPTFSINLTGTGVQPGLSFSFLTYNFGPCFLYRAGMPLKRTTLVIKNEDSKEISVECLYQSTSHLEVHCQPGVLIPGQKREVDFLFYPREARYYHEVIPFEINGLSTMQVKIHGEGTDMKVEVASAANKRVNLGALRVGQTSHKTVKLVNRSPAPITFTVAITPGEVALQQANILNITPTADIFLRPNGGTSNVEVIFAPKRRIPQFAEEVMLECAGLSQPIFVVTGQCQGIEVTLDSESVPFGAVVQGSRSVRKLIMRNTGDIGAAFAWNADKFGPDFSVGTAEGYISPGMEVPFEIVFHPTVVNHDIRYEGLRCAIEGGKPLKLVLTGSCIPQLPLKEVLHFSTHVRTRETRNLVLHNRTNQLWMLRPIIDGEYWSGPDTITVEPQQTKNYELTYRPLTMSQEGKKHTGSVFFSLPDGSGLLYNVTGTAEGPKPVNNIQRDVPCKTPYTELLTVTNWLRRPQRFRVIIEMIKPDKPDSSTTLKGLDYIDVAGLSKREYKLSFYAHKEGAFSAKVMFRNELSGEYLFYYVTFKATPPGVMAAIELSTPVRQSTSHLVTLHNPLTSPVSFSSQCSVADIQLPPNFTVPPSSEGSCMFEYLPLKAGDVTGRLTFSSSELGLYQYDLILTATPAGLEAPVHFRACLGTSQVQTCRFVNYSRSKVEYSCKVDNSDFHVEKSVTAASASSGGTEVGVDVTYEPGRLGDSRGTLTVVSPVGGEYVFPLFGHCLPPKPQGPYSIKAGSTTSIPFKNVFPHTTQFTFCVDSPSFSVKASESVRGKKTHNIIVSFEGNEGGSKAVKMGRLMITCPRSAGGTGNVTWTYYLKGITP